MPDVSHRQDREESQLQDSWGAQPAGAQPLPSPSEPPPRAERTALGANRGHSLQMFIRFLPRTVMGQRGLAWAPQD